MHQLTASEWDQNLHTTKYWHLIVILGSSWLEINTENVKKMAYGVEVHLLV